MASRCASLVPGYPAVMAALERRRRRSITIDDLFGGPARMLVAARPAISTSSSLDAPHLYDRPGNPYLGADGNDWPDNWQRFAALALVAARIRPRA